tara:strand:+ start:1411 stop:1800 length:390 start_codon:yes stop_codon:yes gene_type:complete
MYKLFSKFFFIFFSMQSFAIDYNCGDQEFKGDVNSVIKVRYLDGINEQFEEKMGEQYILIELNKSVEGRILEGLALRQNNLEYLIPMMIKEKDNIFTSNFISNSNHIKNVTLSAYYGSPCPVIVSKALP